ncbi:site-specific integrase [Aliarcobacter cryaerophilus]|uniref:Uncharacterized protein n=1 Tax=Aliarcobacter cryaerophilus TaxID=28198 RepID=A0A2S9SKN8_9BACT|nr:tyrosine-type recombinase/integrase [Aliarcobacter cryaerophilus]PRM87144.1 hypothetical protein CJ669_09120 [Aliarcobacter cryaerophilus]
MAKNTTFGKNQIVELIEILKKEGVSSTSFYELAQNMDKYFPKHNKTTKQLIIAMRNFSKLFEDACINIYVYREEKQKNTRELVEKALYYIKNDLKKNVITGKELEEILIEKYKFKIKLNTTFLRYNNVKDIMKEINLSFYTSKKQKDNVLAILKDFSESNVVQELKLKNEKIDMPTLYKYLKGEISLTSLYNYSNEIIQMNIPITINKKIKNANYDEKDIINKIASNLKEKGINEIFAGEFSKLGYTYSFPNLGYKKISEYKDYIQEIHNIKILSKDLFDEKKLENTLEDNIKYLNKNNNTKISYSKVLPSYHNDDSDIIAIEECEKDLEIFWIEYLNEYLALLSEDRINVTNELFDKNNKLKINTNNKKIYFLLNEKLHIKDLKLKDIVHLSRKNVLANDKIYGIHRQNMLLGFLIFLYIKKQILFSFEFVYRNMYDSKKVQKELSLFESEFFINKSYQDALKRNILNDKEIKIKRLFYLFCFSLNNFNTKIEAITDEYFNKINMFDATKANLIKKIFNKLGANINISKDSNQFTSDYYFYMKNKNYQDFITICNEHMNRKVKLNQTSIPKTYNKSTSSKIVSFLEFVDKFHTNLILNKDNLTKLFDYPNSKIYTYQEYIDSLEISDNTKSSKISIFLEIFSNTLGYESVFTKGKLPNYNTSVPSKREAIEDEEIIYKIDDIVTKRPPKSNYFNNHKVSVDTSWWEHFDKVVPFEPLIIKLNLRIPTRGASLRLIDRDSLLVIGNRGNIKGFHFVSDKNKKRKEPFIVPNIWKSELSFLINLIEYNKAFFPFLKKHYPDDITLKNGILPLFPNSDGTGAYTESQHMLYWTKVLIQAQMEFNHENKNKFLVYSKEVDLPTTQEGIDNLTIGEINTFKKKYDIHSLRHTGITRNIKAGMPLELVRMLSGHSGFNTILTIYYHIKQEELVNNWLKTHNIDITEDINMHETSQLFIKKELLKDEIKTKNPEVLLKILNNYNFFNPQNRDLAFKDGITLAKIAESEPTYWKPLRIGICTKTQCPSEIIGRCSLCPYFITNYMFTQEIGLEMQLSMARVKKYSEMIIKNREDGNNFNNSKLKQQMNNEIEDFTAWLEILSLANSSYNDSQYNLNKVKNHTSLISYSNQTEDSIFALIPSLNIEHGYLEILSETYKRKIYDNETVVDITNIMANKIIKYTINNNSYTDIEDLNNEEIIKWFLPTYKKISNNWQTNEKSKQELENLLKLLENKKIKLEYKNENPLLAK